MEMWQKKYDPRQHLGFSNKAFRKTLILGKAYKIKNPLGRDDVQANYIWAKLIAIYPTYALFDVGNYKTCSRHHELANGGMLIK